MSRAPLPAVPENPHQADLAADRTLGSRHNGCCRARVWAKNEKTWLGGSRDCSLRYWKCPLLEEGPLVLPGIITQKLY